MSFVQNKLAQANAFYLFIFLCVLKQGVNFDQRNKKRHLHKKKKTVF